MKTTALNNSGHGHVWKRPDGAVARCGGPSLCPPCAVDLFSFNETNQLEIEMPVLKIKKIHPHAKTPTYSTEDAACFDIYSTDARFIPNGEGMTFGTGLTMEIPRGWKMLVYSRSGQGFKYDVRLSNCVGVIDADYRGELMVRVFNDGGLPYAVSVGDRIAQAELVPAYKTSFEEVEELTDTKRGGGGLGSTGK